MNQYILFFVLISIVFVVSEERIVPSLATGVLEENLEEVRKALDAGEDVNLKLKDGSNVLQLAIWSSKSLESVKPILDLLVERGIDVDNANQMGHTALHAAAVAGKIDFIEYLIQHGANVNAVDSDNTTPIMIAAWKGNLETVTFLVEQGKADVNVKNKIGLGLVDYAQKHPEVKQYLKSVVRDAKQAVDDMKKTAEAGGKATLNSEGKGKLGQFGKLMKKLSKGDMREWTVEDTLFWLNTIGLDEKNKEVEIIKTAFKENNIDGNKLARMRPEAMKELLKDVRGETRDFIFTLKQKYVHKGQAPKAIKKKEAPEGNKMMEALFKHDEL